MSHIWLKKNVKYNKQTRFPANYTRDNPQHFCYHPTFYPLFYIIENEQQKSIYLTQHT